MKGILYIEDFVPNSIKLFDYFKENANWETSMKSRYTASYGQPYNYSQIRYPQVQFDSKLEAIIAKLLPIIEFSANNCLLNYYLNSNSKMGFHSDDIDILEEKTGVAIVSLGSPRILRFRNIKNQELKVDFQLDAGSLLYMTQEVQLEWQHAILKTKEDSERISLAFRRIK